MKVYTTKYALTAGIEVKEVEPGSAGSQILVGDKYVYTKGNYLQQFVMGRNAFLTYPEAAKAAREMRDKKQASLTRQLLKVSSLIFETKNPFGLE